MPYTLCYRLMRNGIHFLQDFIGKVPERFLGDDFPVHGAAFISVLESFNLTTERYGQIPKTEYGFYTRNIDFANDNVRQEFVASGKTLCSRLELTAKKFWDWANKRKAHNHFRPQ